MDIRELARLPLYEQMRLRLFDRDASGRTVYLPFGATNPLIRRGYVVPDEARAQRLLVTHRRAELAAFAVVVAFLLAAVLAFHHAADSALDALRSVGALGVVAGLAVVMLPLYLPTLVALALHGDLDRAGPRSYQDVVARQDHLAASNKVLAFAAVLLVIVGLAEAGFAVQLARKGYTTMALIVATSLVFVVALLATFPGVAKLRRLRAENERLEAVVRERTAELEDLNRTLEARVAEQVRDIERLGQLRHFFAAPVAEAILGESGFDPGRVHRRELSVVSVDLRGFTAFSETAEPEEVIAVLRIYHAELGILVNRHRATLEHFAGDGALVFLNDPVEIEDYPRRAVCLAAELRAAMRPHLEQWRRNGFDLGIGAGVAVGYATIGAIGYEGRWEYAAIGNVCNLAAQLCSGACDGQVVTTERVGSRAGVELSPLGERSLKGFSRPVAAYDVVGTPTA